MNDRPWNTHLRALIWLRLKVHPLRDPAVWRLDAHGNLIYFHHYGKRDSEYGWELDHWPTPKMFGGTDDPTNLRALHWRANATHGGLLGLGKKITESQQKGLFGLLA